MFKQARVAPSILSADFAALGEAVALVEHAGADLIHVDVMDGHFVPNLTMGPAHVSALKKVCGVPLDVHLMIDNPIVQIPWFLDAGADIVTFHIEACDDGDQALGLIDAVHEAGAKAGIAISPDTDTHAIDGLLRDVDLVLVMSVYPGFGGQAFLEGAPARIGEVVAACRKAGVAPAIEVDGGIDAATAPLVLAAGADVLVAGSAVFGSPDPAQAIRGIRGSL